MNFKLLLVLFVTCAVAWAQDQSSSSAPLPEQPVAEVSSSAQPVPEASSSAQPVPAAPSQQPSPSSSAPAQEPSPTVPPQETPAATSAPAQNPSSPPAIPPPEEEQGAQSGGNNANGIPPAGLVTNSTTPPTTPAPTTPPTTPAPTTTPTTTTTPAPKPVTPPPPFPKNTGSWSIKEDHKQSPCLIFNAAIQLHVKGNSSANVTAVVVDVPSTLEGVVLNGQCGPEKQKLSISWYSSRNETDTQLFHNHLTLRFAKQVDSNYALLNAEFQYNLKDETPKNFSVGGPFFLTSLQHSYRCHSEQRVETEAGSLIVLTEELQFEAFRDDTVNSTLFSAADECKADHRTSTAAVVGIGFGIGLLIVVCIALGIYLFKRFRNREGYQPLDSQN
ncbi:unnamed protein product [Orchesella dallaii]|uniref:Lysosome-associated membrane glycoprotein 5 n=1 Tax=Orchesella dallaii TaxID=48710 RepID=A0ABP1Q3C4_9HEXA